MKASHMSQVPNRKWAILRWLAVLLIAMALISQVSLREGLAILLPANKAYERQRVVFFEENSRSQRLALEAQPLGNSLDRELLRRELQRVIQVLVAEHGLSPAQQSIPMGAELEQLKLLQELTPRLVRPEQFKRIRQQLEQPALRQRLEGIAAYLRRPDRSGNAWALLADPLSLSGDLIKPLADLNQQGHDIDGNLTWHRDGASVMALLSVPFAPSDSRHTNPMLARIDALAQQAANKGVHLDYVGSYRHFRDNNRSINSTLIRTIPLSLLLIGIALLSLFRSIPAVALLHIPVAAAAIGSAIALSLGSGLHIPLIVLGFGSCLIGIAIDYGIHMTHAAMQGHARQVLRPIAISAATTGCAMLVLLLSDIPIITHLGYLLIGGITAACLAACDLLPRLLRPQPAHRLGWQGLGHGIDGWMGKATPKRLVIAAVITAVLIPGLWRLDFIADLRAMDGSSAATKATLATFEQRWGFRSSADFLLASDEGANSGDSLDQALRKLRLGREAAGLTPSPLESLLPDRAQQLRNLSAWNAFWETESANFAQRLERICAEIGLRSSAFAEALQAYRPCHSDPSDSGQLTRPFPAFISAQTWSDTPVAQLIQHSITQDADGTQIAVMIPRPADEDLAQIDQLSREQGIVFASRRLLADDLIDAARHEFFSRGGMVIATMLLVLVCCLRNSRAIAAVAIPPCLTLVWTFGLLGLMGTPLMPSHVIVAAFVCGIGIDDALFLSLNKRRRASIAPICATTLSTIIGVGSLTLSDHPILVSTGQALVVGMASCLLSCLLVCPAIVKNASEIDR